MTLNEIIQAVRDELGEAGGNLWTTEEIVRWVHLSLNRHARKALSVEAEVLTTSLPNVQEYLLPADFGELKNVRFCYDEYTHTTPIAYVDKQSIVTAFGSIDALGSPYACYIYQNKLGLYPVPDRSPAVECVFEDICQTFLDINDEDGAYQSDFQIQIQEDGPGSGSGAYIPSAPQAGDISSTPMAAPSTPVVEETPDSEEDCDIIVARIGDDCEEDEEETPVVVETPTVSPDPCQVYISHVGLYLRRKGLPYPGDIQLALIPPDTDANRYTHYSKPILASDIAPRPAWYFFDFTLSPIEINETLNRWTLRLSGDDQYNAISPADKSGAGVQIGVDDDCTAWLKMIRNRNDIQVDYYRNSVKPITDYDDRLDLPFYPMEKSHDTIIGMTLEYALRKGQYDIPTANYYRQTNEEDMRYTRAQATLKTRGDIIRVPQEVRLALIDDGPYIYYRNGSFLGRAW